MASGTGRYFPLVAAAAATNHLANVGRALTYAPMQSALSGHTQPKTERVGDRGRLKGKLRGKERKTGVGGGGIWRVTWYVLMGRVHTAQGGTRDYACPVASWKDRTTLAISRPLNLC